MNQQNKCKRDAKHQWTTAPLYLEILISGFQELERSLLQKEEESRKIQSLAAEMEEDLNRALQEKQVGISCVEENIPSSFSWQTDNVIMNY